MATAYRDMTPKQRRAANARGERWKLKNREKVLEYKRKHYKANRQKYLTIERDRQYRKRYGITLAQYEELLVAQGGACAICGAQQAGAKNQAFAVDHDHSTGAVRGLLCIKCNARLGWVEVHGAGALAYLARHGKTLA